MDLQSWDGEGSPALTVLRTPAVPQRALVEKPLPAQPQFGLSLLDS